jgi:hypothetical protein
MKGGNIFASSLCFRLHKITWVCVVERRFRVMRNRVNANHYPHPDPQRHCTYLHCRGEMFFRDLLFLFKLAGYGGCSIGGQASHYQLSCLLFPQAHRIVTSHRL